MKKTNNMSPYNYNFNRIFLSSNNNIYKKKKLNKKLI